MRNKVYQAEVPRPRPTLQNPRPITYLGASTFVVKGASTGLTYLFTRDEALNVDERDVAGFVAMGIFAAATQEA